MKNIQTQKILKKFKQWVIKKRYVYQQTISLSQAGYQMKAYHPLYTFETVFNLKKKMQKDSQL